MVEKWGFGEGGGNAAGRTHGGERREKRNKIQDIL